MKKLLCVLVVMAMVLGVLAGCSPAEKEPGASDVEGPGEEIEQPAEVKIMKIAGTMSQSESDGEFTGTKKFAELVEQYTEGSIKVEIYPSSQLGSFAEFSEGVMMGSIESAICGASGMGTSDPFLFFLEMPYIFKDLDHARNLWETDNDAKKQLDDHLAELNMVSVGTLYRSPRVWCNNIRPVKSTDDNKGVKMRTPESPISVSLASAMGASPVTVAWSEVYTALSSGTASGVENTITELYNNNLHEVVKYVSETNHMVNTQNILIGKDWFDALSAKEREAIMKAGQEATVWRAEQLQTEVDNAWTEFAAKGVEILEQKDLDIVSFTKAAESVLEEYISKGNFTREFIEYVKKLAP